MSLDILPPNDFELERLALSMLLLDNKYIDSFDELSFYSDDCKKIYKAIKETQSSDFSVIANKSGLSFDDVIEYTTLVVSSTSYDYIIKEVNKYKNARLLLRGSQKLQIQAMGLEIEQGLETISKLNDIIRFVDNDKTIKDITVEYFEDIFTEKKDIKTGYKVLDDFVDIYGGQLVVIAGRPGMGKTTIMQNIAIRQSRDWKVGFISLEMQIFELIDRFVCMIGGLTSYQMKTKKNNYEKIQENLGELIDKKLFLTDNCYNLSRIDQYIKNNELDVCYIDYLGLIQYGDSKTPTIVKVSEITRNLKLIAKRRNCLIILGSQLSRDVEKRAEKRPVLSDLRDSGSIEQDADIVIMAYREEYYDENTEEKNKLELIVRKQRNGNIGTAKLDSNFASYRIIDNGIIQKPF